MMAVCRSVLQCGAVQCVECVDYHGRRGDDDVAVFCIVLQCSVLNV